MFTLFRFLKTLDENLHTLYKKSSIMLKYNGIHLETFCVKRLSLRLGKLHKLRGVQLFERFSSKFVIFSAKFGSLNLQIRNNFKNIIFIACKWSKICNYSVNSMVILCSTCGKEEKECMWVKYLIYAVLSIFQIHCNLRVCPPNLYSQNFRVHKKIFFSKSGLRLLNL